MKQFSPTIIALVSALFVAGAALHGQGAGTTGKPVPKPGVRGASAKTHDNTIEVITASYGLNVSAADAGNATTYLKAACNGKVNCGFQIQDAAGKIGDPHPGAKKDFYFAYNCGKEFKSGLVQGESNTKAAMLTCAK